MTPLRLSKVRKQDLFASLSVVVSGIAWYFGNALTGTYWYLVWLTPTPLFILAYHYSPKVSFRLAFAACLLGRLSWLAYLQTVVSLVPALLLTLALAYVFARIIVLSATTLRSLNTWSSVFAYPVLMTSFEFLVSTFSPDGTATSLAYTQADVIPLIQIASLTGSLGITFLVSFFSSLVAVGWWAYQRNKNWISYLLSTALLVYGLSFSYSFFRINDRKPLSEIKAGLVVLPEKRHYKAQQATARQLEHLLDDYAQAIASAVVQGAAIVVLPETAIHVRSETYQSVVTSLKAIARHYHVCLVVGLANFSQPQARNTAFVIDADGKVVADYTKNHLVRGFERQFTPGNRIGLFTLADYETGVAICKDLDFPNYIRQYGTEPITSLFVPANDFVVDDWLHSRMAVIRGIENGFSVVRTARQGRLTISNDLGEVLSEANTSAGNKAVLVGSLPASHQGSVYAKTGNWFGIVNLLLAAYILWRTRMSRKSSISIQGNSLRV